MIAGIGYNGDLYGLYPQYQAGRVSPVSTVDKVGSGDTMSAKMGNVGKTECQTCKSRKYVDGSNEGNVSYKAPTHISPQASAAAVKSHEMEHVSNARAEGSEPGKELVSATVSLQVSTCPECGRSYVSGGTTTTQIKYEESNPYERARKTVEGSFLAGQNVDMFA